jgi:hypothetical protein
MQNETPVPFDKDFAKASLGERIPIVCNLGLPWLPKNFNVVLSFNADHWAASFLQTLRENPAIVIDHSLMVTWFANSLMAGYDHRHFQSKEYKRQIRACLVPWWKRWLVPLSKFGRA